jgi:hypothetical protein
MTTTQRCEECGGKLRIRNSRKLKVGTNRKALCECTCKGCKYRAVAIIRPAEIIEIRAVDTHSPELHSTNPDRI